MLVKHFLKQIQNEYASALIQIKTFTVVLSYYNVVWQQTATSDNSLVWTII